MTALLASGTPPDPALPGLLEARTGLAAERWAKDLNLKPDTFRSNLLPGTLLGRYDGRVTAPAGSDLARDGDPSSTFITPSFRRAIVTYLRDDLGYPEAAGYQISGDAIDHWDFYHDGQELPDTIPDLAAALRLAPGLKVLSLNGYHDLATPFYQTELDLARLGGQPNLGIRGYNSGHMVYLDDASRAQERADLVAFYQGGPGWRGQGGAVPQPVRRPVPGLVGEPGPAAPPAPPVTPGPDRPLYDPYVPPGLRRRPGAAPAGAALDAQVRRKLEALKAAPTPGPAPGPGRR